jgi:hypothetical protein
MATPRYLLLLMFLPCLLRPVATTQSQQKMDEAQLLLQIKSVWGDPPVLASCMECLGRQRVLQVAILPSKSRVRSQTL